MDRNKKIWLGISLTAVAVGGFFLTKYLTRNVVKEKYITYIINKDAGAEINSNDIP